MADDTGDDVAVDDDDPFVISLFRYGDNDLDITVRGQTIRVSNEDARGLLDMLEDWYSPLGRDVDIRAWHWGVAPTDGDATTNL